jgi:tetratricopeptide (TPR) repeat protein
VFRGSGLDAGLYLVAPFASRAGVPAGLGGDACELALHDAVSRGRDVRLVDGLRAHDLAARRAAPVAHLGDALELARAAGAGRLLWGEVTPRGDSVEITAGVYDVARGSAALKSHMVRVAAKRGALDARFRELADSLLLGGMAAGSSAASLGTDRLSALVAYDSGHAALAGWDLAGAATGFRHAVAQDTDFPDANYQLAQVLAWAGAPSEEWSAYAGRAVASPRGLGRREQLLAAGLVAMADRRFPEACARYGEVRRSDTLDFVAWFGLAECNAKDKVVVADAGSPSGWRFRGSVHTALTAYSRALRLNPSAHRAFFGQLPRLFFVESNRYDEGRALPPDSGRFGAWPGLAGDTLTAIPYPLAELLAGDPRTQVSTNQAALGRVREMVRQIAVAWVRAFPREAGAREELALLLETQGALAPAPLEERSALATLRRARQLANDPTQALRLATAETRLLVKLEEVDAAALLADSLLRANPRPPPSAAARLAGLAALTGQTRVTAELLRRSAPVDSPTANTGEVITGDSTLHDTALTLLAYAALGAPADSLSVLVARVERLIARTIRPDRQSAALSALEAPAAVLVFPVVGETPLHGSDVSGGYLLDMQRALARGDPAAARARYARVRAVRRGLRPTDVSISSTYSEARVFLDLGDTAVAVTVLDSSLNDLPGFGTGLLDYVPQAAGLVRAMALRAELAAAAGDARTARWWAQHVVGLWSRADQPLQPLVRRMRALAGAT